MRYRHCPLCGAKLTARPAGDDGPVPYCEGCRKYWFDAFHTCVIVLVYNEENEIVLSRQSHLSAQYATLTSGYITPGESAEDCARREVREELGLTVERLEFAGTYPMSEKDLLMVGFFACAAKAPLVISQELQSAQWVPAPEVPKTLVPKGRVAHRLYERFLEEKRIGSDVPEGE